MKLLELFCAFGVFIVLPRENEADSARTGDWNGLLNETIQLNVRKAENDGKVLQVSLRVHVIEGHVHINGHPVDHAVVTAIHLRASLTCHGKTHPAMVHVRVMVTEGKKDNVLKLLTVQEEIVEIDDKAVTQIDVKELVLELRDGKKEIRRQVTVISLERSKIHAVNRETDKHIYTEGGKLPDSPFRASKHDMEMFHKVPNSDLKPPRLPDSWLHGPSENGDEGDEEDEKEWKQHGHRHGKYHHHHRHRHHHKHHGHDRFTKWKRGFCSWFHKLPLAARVAIFVSVLLVGGAGLACCVKCLCCSKPKKIEGEKVDEDEGKKNPSDDDFDIVGPLPQKKPIDEMQLIA